MTVLPTHLVSDLEQMLFPTLSAEDIDCLREHGDEVELAAGEALFLEGERATHMAIVLEGEIRVTRRAGGSVVVLATHRVGSFTGDLNLLTGGRIAASAHATQPTRVIRIPAESLHAILGLCPSMAAMFIGAMSARYREATALVEQREKLASLGRVAAGLAHELNNPAAAGRRAGEQLAQRLRQWPTLALRLAELHLNRQQLDALTEFDRELEQRPLSSQTLDPVERADREDELSGWLTQQGMSDSYTLAPSLIEAGVDRARLEALAKRLPPEGLGLVIEWLAASLDVMMMTRTVIESTVRISELVASVKQYSHMDAAPLCEVDLREGLESTLTMLSHKLARGQIEIVRDYDSSIPPVCGYPGELNQVWTNLIDNALDAMGQRGRLTVHTRQMQEWVIVEIMDTGTGIPPEVQPRIFDPFFTTKPMGQGTGLGLDVSYRVIVRRHHGDIRFDTSSHGTRF